MKKCILFFVFFVFYAYAGDLVLLHNYNKAITQAKKTHKFVLMMYSIKT